MNESPGAPGVPGPAGTPGAGLDNRHRRRGRRRHRSADPGSSSRLDRTRRRALVGIAVIGALVVAVAIPVLLTVAAPASPTRTPNLPTPTLPGGNASRPATPRPTVVAGASGADPAGSAVAPAGSGSASDRVGATVATRIRIARLGIDLPIIEGDGIDAPIDKAAHYPGTGWPGGGTNIYLYGHARAGMFLPLWDARVGDTITLDLAGGGERTYRVVEVLPRVPWNAEQYLAPTPDEILTLQTSTSYYATAPRFIVIAEPVT
jgi:LPXTG-site transpeptidase (sortase) family protein